MMCPNRRSGKRGRYHLKRTAAPRCADQGHNLRNFLAAVGDKVLRAAAYRFAEAVRAGNAARYSAISQLTSGVARE
ncbi:hypothetical protein NOVOSPHI9U_680026 [Novosphingobium sp. 9U]|nr:hypothetical protein NOVOSPHI9U_680026 [Novosphingobium sp. 9U]